MGGGPSRRPGPWLDAAARRRRRAGARRPAAHAAGPARTAGAGRRRISSPMLVVAGARLGLRGRRAARRRAGVLRRAVRRPRALSQRVHTERPSPADRGSIFDRNGNTLGDERAAAHGLGRPGLVTAPAHEAAGAGPRARARRGHRHVRAQPTGPVRLRGADGRRRPRPHEVKALNLPGIVLVDEPKRFEPDGTLAAPVIGPVGIDDQGLTGLEYQYDTGAGRPPGQARERGRPVRQAHPRRRIPRLTPATKGSDLVLTLDRSLQYEVEQDLSKEILAAKAKGGMAIVMDRTTGEILALANLTLAARLDDRGAVGRQRRGHDRVRAGLGREADHGVGRAGPGRREADHRADVPDHVRIYDATFRDDTPHPVEQWTPTDILTASSNVGRAHPRHAVGQARPGRTTCTSFGLGSETALHFPYESAGLLLDPSKWSGTTLATVVVRPGHGGHRHAAGRRLQHHRQRWGLRRAQAGQGHGRRLRARDPTPPSATHRVVSATVAREVSAMLTEVVRGGTGTEAAISGYQVAGKTGTARKSSWASRATEELRGQLRRLRPRLRPGVHRDGGARPADPHLRRPRRRAGVPRHRHLRPARAAAWRRPRPIGAVRRRPHAQPSAATAADEPGKTGGFVAATSPSPIGLGRPAAGRPPAADDDAPPRPPPPGSPSGPAGR